MADRRPSEHGKERARHFQEAVRYRGDGLAVKWHYNARALFLIHSILPCGAVPLARRVTSTKRDHISLMILVVFVGRRSMRFTFGGRLLYTALDAGSRNLQLKRIPLIAPSFVVSFCVFSELQENGCGGSPQSHIYRVYDSTNYYNIRLLALIYIVCTFKISYLLFYHNQIS